MKMKRSYILSLIVVLCSVSVSYAQQNMRTGYFLDGYTYRYKMNPAIQGERGFLSIPALGKVGVGVESNLGLSTFLYPSADGTLKTFLHPDVTDKEFLDKMRHGNLIMANMDLPVMALGFRTGKAYHTLDVSLRADVDANLTKDLFSFMKSGASNGVNSWNLSDFGVKGQAYAEMAYGLSRRIGEKVTVGARAKLLVGLARADIAMENMNLTMSGEEWAVNAKGKASVAGPINLETDANGLIDFSSITLKTEEEINQYLEDPAKGFALDLGMTADLLDWLTLSASVTDLGKVGWKNVVMASTPQTSWSFTGFNNLRLDAENSLSQELESMVEDLSDAINIKKDGSVDHKSEKLSATAYLGLEARLPFYKRLTVGALGTHHMDGAYSWSEARMSVNWALLRIFSVSGSYAISTIGESLGAAANIHIPGLTLYAGIDSLLPVMNMTPSYIPIDACNTNVTVGLNIAFGKYRGRYMREK